MRESDVENHLIERVKQLDGEVRKVKWIGRNHAPDRLVLLPTRHSLVELKAPLKGCRPGQLREHERLRTAGFEVVVLDSIEAVDQWIEGKTTWNTAN